PGGACDIEVDPGRLLGEFLEEDGGGAGAAPASTGVHDVGDAGANHVEILGIERQPPEFFSGSLEGAGETLVNVFIVGKDAGVHAAQSDHAGAGERGGIDQVSAAERLGVVQTVGQDQAAFSVSIDDLDGLAGHGDLHIAWLLRLAAGHVFRSADNGDHLYSGLEQRDSAHGADHGRTAGHVIFHFFHSIVRFYGDTAGVKGDAFAHNADGRFF